MHRSSELRYMGPWFWVKNRRRHHTGAGARSGSDTAKNYQTHQEQIKADKIRWGQIKPNLDSVDLSDDECRTLFDDRGVCWPSSTMMINLLRVWWRSTFLGFDDDWCLHASSIGILHFRACSQREKKLAWAKNNIWQSGAWAKWS